MCTRSSRRGVICRYGCTSFVSPATWPRSAPQICVLRSARPASSWRLRASRCRKPGPRKLHQRTEGWAAGLRLAAISLASSPDPERFVAEFSGSSRTVAEYLLAEMLECQPAEVQQLLLRTSLLDRVNGELADLLTGHPGSEGILLDLEDANAFVVSLDPARTWFRYHHLFADLLRLELRRRLPEQLPALHRLAAGWLSEHGEIVDAIRHTQAAGDWSDAARLLADHSFGLTLDGQAQTIQSLLRAFPPGAVTEGPDIPLARATNELARGHLDEAAAYLTVAETSIAATPVDRQHRLEVATAALRLSLARKRGHLAGVVDQVRFLASPATGQSDEDIALDSDLRAVALMNLGTVEAWSLGNQDSQRHLQEGADLARRIGRPYLEVACLAELAFASKIEPFATTRRRCQEAIALAERHGWGAEPVISPALVNLAGVLIWTGEFDEADLWLRRTARALETDTGPLIWLVLHMGTGMLFAGRQMCHRGARGIQRGRRPAGTARRLTRAGEAADQLAAGHPSSARAAQRGPGVAGRIGRRPGSSGEIGNARAAICLAEGNPAAALAAVHDVLDGTAPAIGYVTVVEANLLAALAHRELGDQRAATAATESALALSEADRLVLPFAITGSLKLLEAMPPHETAHAALVTDIVEIIRGSSIAPGNEPSPAEHRPTQPERAAGTAVPPDEPLPAGDRQGAIGLGEHRQHPHPQHLRQASGSGSFLSGPARQRDAAALGRPDRVVTLLSREIAAQGGESRLNGQPGSVGARRQSRGRDPSSLRTRQERHRGFSSRLPSCRF